MFKTIDRGQAKSGEKNSREAEQSPTPPKESRLHEREAFELSRCGRERKRKKRKERRRENKEKRMLNLKREFSACIQRIRKECKGSHKKTTGDGRFWASREAGPVSLLLSRRSYLVTVLNPVLQFGGFTELSSFRRFFPCDSLCHKRISLLNKGSQP